MASVGAAIEVDVVLSTLATVSLVSLVSDITCEAQALTGGPLSADCDKARVPVFHGSVNNARAIRARPGLDPFMLPVVVSRDRAAALDAILKSQDTDPNNNDIFESDIPSVIFAIEFVPRLLVEIRLASSTLSCAERRGVCRRSWS
jgi:hypothetical protein